MKSKIKLTYNYAVDYYLNMQKKEPQQIPC